MKGNSEVRMRLLPDDLMERIHRARARNQTGDCEVIAWLARSGEVDEWVRDEDGTDRIIPNENILAAVEVGFEVR